MKTKPISKINTINVIEYIDGAVAQIFSFPDNTVGCIRAENLFAQICQENAPNNITLKKKEIDSFIEDGIYEDSTGNWQVFLTHSS